MSPNRHKFTSFVEIEPKPVKAADKAMFMATGIGSMEISIPNGATSTNVTLQDVLYCPDLAFTLVSLARCDTAGYTVLLKDQACVINNKTGHTIGRVPLTNGLYRVDRETAASTTAYSGIKVSSLDEVHQKMGHISHQAAKRLVEQKIVLGIELDKESLPMFCQTCAKAKPTRKPILKECANSPARQLGDKIHSDVWGPTTPTSYNVKSYYVSFTDDHTHWSMVKCITKKSDVVSRYKDYEAWLDTQHSCNIKILQSDCGGKYLLDDFNAYLKRKGTVRHLTVHDTPEENGVTEHLNQTLLEHTHAMIIAANLPKNLWPEAIHHAVWLKNRTST